MTAPLATVAHDRDWNSGHFSRSSLFRMVPLYLARIEDPAPDDFLKIDCAGWLPKAPTEFGRAPLLPHGAPFPRRS